MSCGNGSGRTSMFFSDADNGVDGFESGTLTNQVVSERLWQHHYQDVIGRKHDKETIIQFSVQQNPCADDKNHSDIPIVGTGRMVRTTLAKCVSKDKRIDGSFSLKIWACVSHHFDIKQVIIKMIISANDFTSVYVCAHQGSFNKLDMEQLQNHLGPAKVSAYLGRCME